MKKYRLSICKGPECRLGGSERLFATAKEGVAREGLQAHCIVGRGGCYGLCHLGPNVVVREDTGRPKDPLSQEDYQLMGWDGEVHYGSMTPEKLGRIICQHLGQDAPVADLVTPERAPETAPPLERAGSAPLKQSGGKR